MNVPAPTAAEKILLDAEGLRRTLSRIAHEIIEGNPDLTRVALVGIQTRGVPLAQRLRRLVEERAGEAPALGAVDITFYRDDVQVRGGDAPRHPRRRRAAACDSAHVRAVGRARGQEAADAERPAGDQRLLRVVDAHVLEL